MTKVLDVLPGRVTSAVLGAFALVLSVVGIVGAADDPVYDWSEYIDTTGLIEGALAAVAAVFAVAVLIRLSFKAARLTMKALGFIK